MDDARRTLGPAGVSLPPQEKSGAPCLQAGGLAKPGAVRISSILLPDRSAGRHRDDDDFDVRMSPELLIGV
jgi:hypothetical protein